MLAYTITFQPGRYYVAPMGAGNSVGAEALKPGAPPYWAVVDEASRRPVGFAFEENQAKVIAFSLNLVVARINGDRAAEAALSRALDLMAKA